ncbi:MAG: SGNH/GDSL hydrolase family protein [Phycisphaeraceae bacterium]|nr:SGNH/GDSL hydrolase family protein [Phycisphaeraceae bacterium]
MSTPSDAPLLFVIGDSISVHYGPYLARMLESSFRYNRKGGLETDKFDLNDQAINGGDSRRVVEYLERLADRQFHADWLLLNCGLHDVKRDPATMALQVPAEQYQENLRRAVALGRRVAERVIWVRTTPVDDAIHRAKKSSFVRQQSDVAAFNAAADAIAMEHRLAIIDLHGFTAGLEGPLYEDHVHFVEPVRRLQAAFIAGHLLAWAGLDQPRAS